MSPLWGFGVFGVYKHVAPLGLNAAQFAVILLSTCRPSGAFWCVLVYMPPCYKHAAPLGLNARVHLSSDGLGNPTPTNSIPLGLNAAQFAVRHPS